MHRIVRLTAPLIALLCATLPATAQVLTFEDDVRPLLAANCTACHNTNSPAGSYALDSFAGALRPGKDSTPNVIPGFDADSLLVTRLAADLDTPSKLHPDSSTSGAFQPSLTMIDTLRRWIVFDNARQFRQTLYGDRLPVTSSPAPAIAPALGPAPAGKNCGQCHSPAGSNQGNYDTTTYEGLFGNGLDNVPNVLPGIRESRLVSRLQQDLDANPSDPRHNGLAIDTALVDRLRDWIANDRARFFRSQTFNSDISILFSTPPGGTGCNQACHISGNASAGRYDLTNYNNLFGLGSDNSIPNVIVGDKTSKLITRLQEDLAANRKHPDDITAGAVTLTPEYVDRIASWILSDAARQDTNNVPRANAGLDLTGRAGISSSFLGAGTDVDPRDVLFFNWILDRRPGGSVTSFTNPGRPSFNFRPDVNGSYQFTMQVNDGTDAHLDSVKFEVAPNRQPVAVAGPDQSTLPGSIVTLDGRGSSDPDGDTLTFTWTFLSVPVGSNINNGSLLNPRTANPGFTPDVAGTYIVTLTVSDGQIAATDRVEIVARGTNTTPVANAGPPRRSRRKAAVMVDGRASRDSDGEPLTYTWSFLSVPAGSAVANTSLDPNPNAVTPSFTPDLGGNYLLSLVVSDGTLASAPATVNVTAALNKIPIAVAEANGNADPFLAGKAHLGTNSIVLDAAKSTDGDQDMLTYTWTLRGVPAGSRTTTGDITRNGNSLAVTANLTPDVAGAYSFGLVVNDGLDNSASAFATVEVQPNFVPTANAGPDRGGVTNTGVTLNASRSRDFESDTLTYIWTLVSAPNGAAIGAAGEKQRGPSPTFAFTPDKPGNYQFTLIVNDSAGGTDVARNSTPDTINVNVHDAANNAPTAAAGANQSIPLGATVTLNGAGTDPNNDPISYAWTLSQKPPASLLGDSSLSPDRFQAKPTFKPDAAGDFRWRLTVNDGIADSANVAEVTISVTNTVPRAVPGPPQANFQLFLTPPAQLVTLDGTASVDPENQPLSYTWALVAKPVGSALTNPSIQPNGNQQSGAAAFTPDRKGLYSISLVVNDGVHDSAPAGTSITVGNAPPAGAATTLVTTNIGNNVPLLASGFDPDVEDKLTYHWSVVGVPPGSSISDTRLSTNDTTGAARNSFIPDLAGIYLFRVQVFDGAIRSAPVTVRVTVVNTPPRASAVVVTAPPVHALDEVKLDGSGTRDDETTDINKLAFNWFFIKVPQSSSVTNANFSGRTSIAPRFSPDRKGLYTVGLLVSDGFLTSTTATADVNVVNSAPQANAGPDQQVRFGTTVQLDGRGSLDVNAEDVLLHTWSIVSSPPADPVTTGRFAPNGTTLSSRPFFTPRAEGRYEIQLVVNDGVESSAPDKMVLQVSNQSPVANAGLDNPAAKVRNRVQLDGTGSSDPDGNVLTYSWSFASLPASGGSTLTQASLSPNNSTTASKPSFVPDVAGTYRVQLIVSDGLETAGPDEVVITASNTAPTAKAGDDQLEALQGRDLRLDGSNSTDEETPNALRYSWDFTMRPPQSAVTSASLTPSSTSPTPSFRADRRGDYQLTLTVSDGLLTGQDSVLFRVINSRPTANAGSDITTGAGVVTALDGSASKDPDAEDRLTYQWSLLKKPTASQVTTGSLDINNSTLAARPRFRPDQSGSYEWRLVVVDDLPVPATSSPDTVTISVVNSIPVAVPRVTPATLRAPDRFQCDGSGSTDNETPGSLTYVWSFLSAPPGSRLDNSSFETTRTLVNPSFKPDRKGTYQVELLVNDGLKDSLPQSVSVAVQNTTPTAAAGSSITTVFGRTIRLAGGAFDADEEDRPRLVYSWRFASQPPVAGSTLTTSAFSTNDTTAAASPTFTPDRDGVYRIRLTVTDGEATSTADEVVVTVTNTAPTASTASTASSQQNPITLDGTGSSDPDENAVTYRWTFASVPPVSGSTLTNAAISPNNSRAARIARFTADKKGLYVVQLTVNDGLVDSTRVTTSVTVVNSPPVANAGDDFGSSIKFPVTLDGTRSSDPNPDDRAGLVYRWGLVGPTGSAVSTASILVNNSTAASRTSFKPDVSGAYTATLTLSDSESAVSTPDAVVITVTNQRPIARAGADQSGRTVQVGIQMDGGLSSDIEGSALSYSWSFASLPASAGSTLTSLAFQPNGTADAARPNWKADRKGTYTVTLVVNDGLSDSLPDTATVQVINSPPLANAGNDITARFGNSVNLDGRRSRDPNFEDNATMVYNWSVVSVPSGSRIDSGDLSPNNGAAAARPGFRPDVPGLYTFSLTVRDAEDVSSSADQVVVRVENLAPVALASPDRVTTADAPVALSGAASSDPEGLTLTFLWSFLAVPSGSGMGSSSFEPSATAVTPTFRPDRKGAYRVRLTVSDSALSATTQVNITILNSAPVALAGGARTASIARAVVLSGSATDPNLEDSLVYRWTLLEAPQRSTVTRNSLSINDSTGAARPSFRPDMRGDYRWRLEVSDGQLTSALTPQSDTTITVGDQRPVASAGPAVSAFSGNLVTLDGSASKDEETQGGNLTYTWSIVSRPAGSALTSTAIVPNGATGANGGARPQLRPDRKGRFSIALSVFDGSSQGTSATTVEVLNSPPVADAGPNKVGRPRDPNPGAPSNAVRLDGGQSSDPDPEDRTRLVYTWAFANKPGASQLPDSALSPNRSSAAAQTSFSPDVAGQYTLSLIVTDPDNVSSVLDTVRVVVTNGDPPPISEPAPVTETKPLGKAVRLDGSASSDPNGGSVSFSWSFNSVPRHSKATISNASSALAAFTPDVNGTYVISLTVSDGLSSDTSLVSVTAEATSDLPPKADAGADQAGTVGATIVLDGADSFDPNGNPVVYTWAQVSGPAAALNDPTSARPSFRPSTGGTYTFQLQVGDGRATSAADLVSVSVSGAGGSSGGTGTGGTGGSSGLLVSAGGSLTGQVGNRVTLRGTIGGSLNGTASILWQYVNGPVPTVALEGGSTLVASFLPSKPGNYNFRLTVSDGLSTAQDAAAIRVNASGLSGSSGVLDAGGGTGGGCHLARGAAASSLPDLIVLLAGLAPLVLRRRRSSLQESGVRSQASGVRDQASGVRLQESGVRSRG
ncbi:MAG: hypothetical protein HYY25_15110 [Candidatus Wallbacteria bacterium]|nr:hypothetical protein [Candidatus Wallbacteria bacterium]